jgi:protein-tyrosine phosphatase
MMNNDEKKRPKNILFVCCGNRERSVIAENLLRQEINDHFPPLATMIVIGSAGIFPKEYLEHAGKRGLAFEYPFFGKAPNIYAINYLAEKGIDASSYRSRRLNEEMARGADLILAIDRLIKKEILSFYPETAGKLFTCNEFAFGAGCVNPDIGDPMKLPEVDAATGAWFWPKEYPASYIAEIEQCLSHALAKFVSYIKAMPHG